MTARQRAAPAACLLLGLLGTIATPVAGSAQEALLPTEQHAAGEPRALAEQYANELGRLEADITPCAAQVAVHRHGIAFRRPQGGAARAPYLTLWVWVDRARPPAGASLLARAGDAFGRYGRPLFGRLLGRSPVFAEPRVGGYGLILTWLGPASSGGRLVGESLAVFADKLAVANFVHEAIGAGTFLARAEVRAFDGQDELPPPRLAVDEDAPVPC